MGSINTGSPMNITGNINDKIIFKKTLQIIRSNAIGVFASATLSAIGEGNTEVYRIADMLGSTKYTQANKNDTADKLNVNEILLHKDNQRKVTYEIEDFDRINIGSEFASIEDVVASTIGLGIAAELDCEFFKAAYNSAVATTNFTVNANYSNATTTAQMDAMYFQTVDIASALEGTVDKSTIGLNKQELITFLPPQATARFIKNGNGGDRNYDNTKNGDFKEINGVSIRTYPLLGKNIVANQSFSKDKAYDFSKIENLTIHTQAIAFSFQMVKVATNMKAESGNLITVNKFQYGIAILRPKLIHLIANATPTPLTYSRTIAPLQLRGDNVKDLIKFENVELKQHIENIGNAADPQGKNKEIEKLKNDLKLTKAKEQKEKAEEKAKAEAETKTKAKAKEPEGAQTTA